MSAFEVKRRDDLSGERRAGIADTLAEAEQRMLAAAVRELDLLVCRDRRSVCLVASTGSALLVDLGRGRVVAAYSFTALAEHYANVDDEHATTAVLELVAAVPGRSWP